MSKTTNFNPLNYEPRWLAEWESRGLFCGTTGDETLKDKKKRFLLFAFAYPSGTGLHVGHVESKTALDILARFYRMQGEAVFFPVGWDAFGLPAENYAIKTGIPPVETTRQAIDTFRRQIKRLAISYDWQSEIATCHPGYYKWTQWLFVQLYKKGLAYQGTGMVNWCPSCQTVLANEQVVEGACERCESTVTQKEMKQWFFRITKYQDELISGLEQVDWPEPTKQQQLHWIGKKEGINISYQVEGTTETVTCFTTRPDTNFGATFIVLAPEHEFAKKVANGVMNSEKTVPNTKVQVNEYLELTKKKTELERQTEGKKKSGVFTGFYAINQLNNKKLPVWVSDFVLSGFGTGAVVGVPGHDMRDFQFAQQFDIPIERVVIGKDGDSSVITREDQVQEAEGVMVNSEFLDGIDIHRATQIMMDHLEEKGWGKRVVTYKLRDWLISRQRYWGAPIPIIYDPEGEPHVIDDVSLPWTLSTDVDFKPTGESPLVSSVEFQQRTEKYVTEHFADLIKKKGWDKSGQGWRPEYDTMDTFVDSSWYYLRYGDARNEEEFASKEKIERWLPVDFYMIGPEHIVLHLLYSRFFTKFLRDEGYLQFDEPFTKMRHQGMILGPDGKKMSKSKGNVINPDDVIEKFGADTLRLYEMFMGPIEADKPWDVRAVSGVYRFLGRLHGLTMTSIEALSIGQEQASQIEVRKALHTMIKKVTGDIPQLKFNTAIAAMMSFVNVWEDQDVELDEDDLAKLVRVIAPFAPFMAEELYQHFGKVDSHAVENSRSSIHEQAWPSWDEELLVESVVKIAVQVNGKLRGEVLVPAEVIEDKEEVIKLALEQQSVKKWMDKEIIKSIYVVGKIINFVTTSSS